MTPQINIALQKNLRTHLFFIYPARMGNLVNDGDNGNDDDDYYDDDGDDDKNDDGCAFYCFFFLFLVTVQKAMLFEVCELTFATFSFRSPLCCSRK